MGQNERHLERDGIKISYVAGQPHVVITHPRFLGQSLILRIPEYVTRLEDGKGICPGEVSWEVVQPDRHLRYRWAASAEQKAVVGVDFWGEARSGSDEVAFEVTMHNTNPEPNSTGVSLFCLQTGSNYAFQDYEGERTFLWCHDRWRTVCDLIEGRWKTHRMCGFSVHPDSTDSRTVRAGLMVKESSGDNRAVGIALDIAKSLSCNHQLWPSCIHANPTWDALAPGAQQTARGKVYYLAGSKDEILTRYRGDFGEG